MVESMTGFGRVTGVFEDLKLTLEIRTLNSKQADLSIKLPSLYRPKEIEIRKQVISSLKRGKIDVSVYYENQKDQARMSLNTSVANGYHNDLKGLMKTLSLPEPNNYLEVLLKMPDIFSSEKKELGKKEWDFIEKKIDEVLKEVRKFRIKEGIELEKALLTHVNDIQEHLTIIQKQDDARQEAIKKRIRLKVAEFAEASKLDENRFEQELIYYLEKADITEEKVRLKMHCDYFKEVLGSNQSQGRKLGFIVQEMGREINTIGSKANDADIQKEVVLMKDGLDKIKEQCANIL